MFIFSLVVFYKFYKSDNYLFYKVVVVWKIYSGSFFWSCCILFFVKLFATHDRDYEGGIFTFIVGIPVFCFVMSVQGDDNALTEFLIER